MTDLSSSDTAAPLRRAVYGILIALAVGNMTGRLLAVNSVDVVRLERHRIKQRLAETEKQLAAKGIEGAELAEALAKRQAKLTEKLRLQRPFLSGNDRSRWATVRSLVELGTYEIDQIVAEPNWDTIDMVSHNGGDDEKHLYSSKPPLLATLVAGEYWVLHKLTGATLGTHPYELGRFMLLTFNVLPLIWMYVLLGRLVERFGRTDFGRLFVMAAATLGTLLSSFAVVLNNHLFGVVAITVAVDSAVRITCDKDQRARWFVLAGLAGAFAVACEMPALSFLALLAVVLLWRAPLETLLWFVPAVLVVAAAFFGTNYLAHGTLEPPYMHKHTDDPEDNWYHYTFIRNGQVKSSYWIDPPGIDRGEPSKGTYALHVLVGHHGIFSLTPVWLLSVAGALAWLLHGRDRGQGAGGRGQETGDSGQETGDSGQETGGRGQETGDREKRAPLAASQRLAGGSGAKRTIAAATLLLTVVCLVFFILLRPQSDRNYGGMTNGFRWMFWLIPLWLVVMLPAADWAARRRWRRGLALLLLGLSVLSAAYATWNPWSQPWIASLFEYLSWVSFN